MGGNFSVAKEKGLWMKLHMVLCSMIHIMSFQKSEWKAVSFVADHFVDQSVASSTFPFCTLK